VVTGTVIDAATDAGIANAYVEADGLSYDDADTDANGAYELALEPGSYTISVSASGYGSESIEFEVTESTTTIPPIELTALPAGLYVSVNNSTFGGPAANAQVTVAPSGGGTATVLTTDASGEVSFLGLATGQYNVGILAANGYASSTPVQVSYNGGAQSLFLTAEINLACEPATASSGLTNMGFENDLNDWTLGYQTETIQAVPADAFTSPWEGAKMARIGNSQTSADVDQPEGPNIMCQDFQVTDAQETFAFNVFTYDYTGFDEFRFDVVVTDPSTGETLAAYEQGAWGSGTQLKTSGWRGVKLDLSDQVGDTVRLTFRAGGTQDSAFPFWAYVDSAATLPPTIETSNVEVETTTGSVTTDPTTGQVTVSMPFGDPSALTMTLPATCQDEETTPTAVSLVLNGMTFAGTPTGDLFTATIPEASIASGQLSVQVVCEGETTLVIPIGQIVLYDPSGIITDAITGQPVVGAEVRLYKVPGWTPQGATGPYPATSCQTNLSKAPDAPWSQPAPTHLGELVNPASPEISPNVNPFVTNNVGYYGWDVAEGCWYVVVEAAGYDDLTSPVVGVPTEVTDLDLTLQPKVLKATAAPVINGNATVGSSVSTSPGSWNTDGATYAYQWLRNGSPIQGATGSTYAVGSADASTGLSVRVTASKPGWTAGEATSGVVQVPAVVVPPVAPLPVVTPPVVTPPVVTPPTTMASSTTKLKLPKKAVAGKRIAAKVTVDVSSGAPATGKIVIKIGKKVVGTGTLKVGKVAIKLKKLKPGTYKLVASYSGSTTVKASTSKKVKLKVVRAAA
jgi:hypothetical protein